MVDRLCSASNRANCLPSSVSGFSASLVRTTEVPLPDCRQFVRSSGRLGVTLSVLIALESDHSSDVLVAPSDFVAPNNDARR